MAPSDQYLPPATDHEPGSGVALGRALRRGWPLVLLIVAVAVAAGLAAASRQAPEYRNTAKLLVNPLSQASGQLLGIDYLRSTGDAERTAQTAAVLVESNEVAEEAARRLGGDWTRASVLRAVAVTPERESNVLAVQATTGDPQSAAQVATAVARSATALRERRVRRQIQTRLRSLERSLRGIDSEDYAARDNVLDEIQELRGATQNDTLSLSVVQIAALPGETVAAPTGVIAALAGLGGLLIGVLAALLLDRLRRRRRTLGPPDVAAPEPAPDGLRAGRGVRVEYEPHGG